MKTTHLLKRKTARLLLALALTLAFIAQALGQTAGPSALTPATSRPTRLTDAPQQRVRAGRPVYFGYELSLATHQYTLISSIAQLDRLAVGEFGVRAGIKLSNTAVALKAFAGMYYSGENVPYTIDMLEGGVAGNLYVLRLKKSTAHTWEPYITATLSYQRAKFYGTYLDHERRNNSVSEEPFLGDVNWVQSSLGVGTEYQLENAQGHFIHFFAEARYGMPFLFHASNQLFGETTTQGPASVQLGVAFGKKR